MLWQSRGGSLPFLPERRAPALPYVDTQGVSRSLVPPMKPVVVVLWVTPCSYCTRALNVLDNVRRLYPESDLDVVGFYINEADDATVERLAQEEGHRITLARGQPSGQYVQALLKGFDFRGTGRDIYVVGADGRYEAVDASDLSTPNYEILQRVRVLLLNKHHLKERSG